MAEAGRVVAGAARGIRLVAPGPGTRPLADRVKQPLFAILEPDLPGAVVLDLFAGSGAGGIEALSRGAARAVFVERDPGAARTIAENLRRTGLAARGRVVRRDALAYLALDAADDGPFDVVLADPPYAETALLAAALERLGVSSSDLLAPRARVVAKHFWRDPPPARVGLLASERERRFGETALTFYRRDDTPATVERGTATADEPDDGRAGRAGEEGAR
ncbi:MAG TPA: 16S rRNA (guanine(966)-N(2))-methyltransferase RsmD [Candidatus Limnocylindrales bacterium]